MKSVRMRGIPADHVVNAGYCALAVSALEDLEARMVYSARTGESHPTDMKYLPKGTDVAFKRRTEARANLSPKVLKDFNYFYRRLSNIRRIRNRIVHGTMMLDMNLNQATLFSARYSKHGSFTFETAAELTRMLKIATDELIDLGQPLISAITMDVYDKFHKGYTFTFTGNVKYALTRSGDYFEVKPVSIIAGVDFDGFLE